jgi:hypothetical protein
MKMEVICSSETWVEFQRTTWCYIPESRTRYCVYREDGLHCFGGTYCHHHQNWRWTINLIIRRYKLKARGQPLHLSYWWKLGRKYTAHRLLWSNPVIQLLLFLFLSWNKLVAQFRTFWVCSTAWPQGPRCPRAPAFAACAVSGGTSK